MIEAEPQNHEVKMMGELLGEILNREGGIRGLRSGPTAHIRNPVKKPLTVKAFVACWLCLGSLPFFSQASESNAPNTMISEAEEFRVVQPGWRARKYGENYYVGTFANTFLSRKAFLGAPEQCQRTVATLPIEVASAGRYLALVRYEAAYRFETRFRLMVEQRGVKVFDRLYGARTNLKVWPFGQRLTNEVAWSWGASENIVWEGHEASLDLAAGPAVLTLVAEPQPEPAARRNVDVVMLTSDLPEVRGRMAKEGYLPLDGLLTQAGDLYLKAHNAENSGPLELAIPSGIEHSPYWVHQRTWKAKSLSAAPGQSTDWLEVGSLLDSLNDGQWQLSAKGPGAKLFSLEFAVPLPAGKMKSIRRFDGLSNDVSLAYDADTRYSHRLRSSAEVLSELVDYLKKQPVRGPAPTRTLIYGSTFSARPKDAAYSASLAEFLRLMGATALSTGSRDEAPPEGLLRGYVDVRDQTPGQLESTCRKISAEGRANRIAVVSLGDEIGLAAPPGNDDDGFRSWLRDRGLTPSELLAGAGEDWEKITYRAGERAVRENPGLYYYGRLYAHHYGTQAQKQLTDVLHRWLPNALIGANYSPHHGHFYLGETHQWVTLFRAGGMTMPWSEDYIFQEPVASQQMNFLSVDLFRAGIRGKAGAKIHFYVMPHWPGNSPASWRRQFYGDLAHGTKIFNLFEFRPVQAAYTENHCSSAEMFQTVRVALHELGQFEDIVQDGQVRPGVAGLWFSEAADIWDDNRAPFDAAKRTLYLAIRHQQLPLDVVVEGDDLSPYRVIYLADQHVSRTAAKALAAWVNAGGRLFATAGAGMWDEFNRPNATLRELLGVDEEELVESNEPLRFEKQDLPFARPIETAQWNQAPMPLFGAVSRVAVKSARIEGRFSDGSPAVTVRDAGQGTATWCGFLPGLTYFKPALPMRPVDRSSRDDSLAQFIPTQFHPGASRLIGSVADCERPVTASSPLVETTIIESRHGSLITLNNWSGHPVKNLALQVNIPLSFRQSSLASGRRLRLSWENGRPLFRLDLEVADALVLR